MGKAVDASLNFATGGMVGYKDGKIGTGITGGAIDKVTGGGLTKGLNGISDTLLGKKDPGTPDQVIDLADPAGRQLQSQALGQYGTFLNKDMGQVAANQITSKKNKLEPRPMIKKGLLSKWLHREAWVILQLASMPY